MINHENVEVTVNIIYFFLSVKMKKCVKLFTKVICQIFASSQYEILTNGTFIPSQYEILTSDFFFPESIRDIDQRNFYELIQDINHVFFQM